MTRDNEKRRKRGGCEGFTLIEIMLVVVILGILAAVVVVQFRGQSGKAKINATRTSIKNICTAIDMYEMEAGKLPSSLADLTTATDERPALIKSDSLKDSWGVGFQYKTVGNFEYEVRSAGPDAQMGSDDDITN